MFLPRGRANSNAVRTVIEPPRNGHFLVCVLRRRPVRRPLPGRYLVKESVVLRDYLPVWQGHLSHWIAAAGDIPIYVFRYEDMLLRAEDVLRCGAGRMPTSFAAAATAAATFFVLRWRVAQSVFSMLFPRTQVASHSSCICHAPSCCCCFCCFCCFCRHLRHRQLLRRACVYFRRSYNHSTYPSSRFSGCSFSCGSGSCHPLFFFNHFRHLRRLLQALPGGWNWSEESIAKAMRQAHVLFLTHGAVLGINTPIIYPLLQSGTA